MEVKINSIELLGQHAVVTSNESYRISIKDTKALEKSEKSSKVVYLESPILSICSKYNFLRISFCLHVTPAKEKRITLKNSKYYIFANTNLYADA